MLARCKTLTTSWRDRYSKEGRELGRLAVEEATSELQGFALDALGTAIPGAGFILSAFLWTIRSARARRAERELIAQPTTGLETTKEADIAEDVVATLRSIARPKFPLIVAIEDLHFADDLLIDVIDQLLVSEQPIMVVTTSWPGEIDQDDCLKPLKWRHNGNRMIRIRHDEPVVDPALPAGAGLQTLHQDERAEIVLLHQPHATPEAKQLLSERYTNPLQLELYCTLPATTTRVRRNGGVFDLRPDDLTNMPSAASLDSMYDAMWTQFPEAVQHALSMALCLVPTVVHKSPLIVENRWDVDLLLAAARSLSTNGDDPDDVLDRTLIEYAWARPVGAGRLRSFHEPSQHTTVARHAAEHIDRESRAILQTAAADLAY